MRRILDSGIGNWDLKTSPPVARGSQVLNSKSRIPNVLSFLLLSVLTLSAATDTGTHFNNLGHHLMCMCSCGQVLMECNHVGCQYSDKMRGELKLAMDRGDSDDQVMNWFIHQYGPVVLAAPTKTGFNRVAWVMPYLVLGLGLTLTGVFITRMAGRKQPAVPAGTMGAGSEESDALRQRVREDTEI